jgi:excinuclease ABC subunit C
MDITPDRVDTAPDRMDIIPDRVDITPGRVDIKETIKHLPAKPGVYQFLDAGGNIIYIGKAKNLKNRVSSYFSGNANQGMKTAILARKTRDIRYVVVDSEQDAFLLENNLIKKYKPRYNVLLKDDKSYPWITITSEPFPRVYLTRRLTRDGSEYHGPYTSGRLAHLLLHLIKSIYKLRTCKLSLVPSRISSGKYKVCLEHHLRNCLAPCVGKIREEEYMQYISQIREILKGNISSVIEVMRGNIETSVRSLQFEKAHALKESIELLKNYQSKSTIVRPSIHDIDVFSYADDGKHAYVNYLRIIHGAINQVHSVELERRLDEPRELLLAYAIFDIREMTCGSSKEIIVPFHPDLKLDGVRFTVPRKGEKRQLLELSERNALFFRLDRERQRASFKQEDGRLHLLTTLKNELKLPSLPRRMECFDNSNTQGHNPVAACVVFLDGKPAKREYRHFHVKTVEGPDDFASMEEIVYRRYARVLDEGSELPDLIVIDGGKGQLHAALNSLEKLNLKGSVPVIGLAKRMEEIYYPGDSEPYIIGKNSLALKTLMHLRDEAHRFGISFHRRAREKGQVVSQLSAIKGVGEKTETALLQHFKSVDGIRDASLEALVSLAGRARGEAVYRFFHP